MRVRLSVRVHRRRPLLVVFGARWKTSRCCRRENKPEPLLSLERIRLSRCSGFFRKEKEQNGITEKNERLT